MKEDRGISGGFGLKTTEEIIEESELKHLMNSIDPPTYNDILNRVAREYAQKLVDNIFQDSPIMSRLRSREPSNFQ